MSNFAHIMGEEVTDSGAISTNSKICIISVYLPIHPLIYSFGPGDVDSERQQSRGHARMNKVVSDRVDKTISDIRKEI